MSTIDTSTWNPDADLNTAIEGIPLNADAGIAQTWKVISILMAAMKGDTNAIKAMITVMEGATASADGASGLVPKPLAGDQDKVLKGDGAWGTVTASSVPWSGITGKPNTFPPSSHAHGNLTNDGKVGTASGKPLVTGTGGAVEAGNFGTTAGTFCEGNDPRLSDARTPTSHAHGSITNDGKLGTASRVVVTDGNKVIGVSGVTANELGYLSGVASAVQTQLDAKAADSAVVHTTGNEAVGGTKTFSISPLVQNSVAFYDAERNVSGGWKVGLGIGGSNKGGIFDWTHMKYIISRMPSSGDVEITAYPDSGTPVKSLVLKSDGTATWNGNAIQTSSDERLKTPLAAVPDEVLDAWGDVGWGQFQFLSAVDCKGESARLHLGLIAQRVKAVFEARGLDACAYGILCHDERPEREVVGEDGKPAVEEAVDLWTVRYAEALAMEAAFQRRRADRLEARIAALEVKLNG